MERRRLAAGLLAVVLVTGLCATALADTIRLRDGSVIRGQIVGFRDQQFTVLIGSGARGRRSRVTLNTEDVESIEFDAAGGDTAASVNSGGGEAVFDSGETDAGRSTTRNPAPTSTRPAPTTRTSPNNQRANIPPAAPTFFQVNVRVRADNSANGWTNSGLVVRRGQRLRITSSGRVSLGNGQFSTPTGLPRITDNNKLMRNEPTGGLIAVIGDDNDEFLFIGSSREFTAERDGILFLGVNEGNLNDNTGVYETVIEAEALAGGPSR